MTSDPLAHVRDLLGAESTDTTALLEYVAEHLAARGVRITIIPETWDRITIPIPVPAHSTPEEQRRRLVRRAMVLQHAVAAWRRRCGRVTRAGAPPIVVARDWFERDEVCHLERLVNEAVKPIISPHLGDIEATDEEIARAARWLEAEQARQAEAPSEVDLAVSPVAPLVRPLQQFGEQAGQTMLAMSAALLSAGAALSALSPSSSARDAAAADEATTPQADHAAEDRQDEIAHTTEDSEEG